MVVPEFTVMVAGRVWVLSPGRDQRLPIKDTVRPIDEFLKVSGFNRIFDSEPAL